MSLVAFPLSKKTSMHVILTNMVVKTVEILYIL